MDDPKQALMSLNAALALAMSLIEEHLPTIDAFLEEERHVDSVMPILDPTRWMSKERQETAALLSPVYRSAKAFAETMAAARASAADMGTQAHG